MRWKESLWVSRISWHDTSLELTCLSLYSIRKKRFGCGFFKIIYNRSSRKRLSFFTKGTPYSSQSTYVLPQDAALLGFYSKRPRLASCPLYRLSKVQRTYEGLAFYVLHVTRCTYLAHPYQKAVPLQAHYTRSRVRTWSAVVTIKPTALMVGTTPISVTHSTFTLVSLKLLADVPKITVRDQDNLQENRGRGYLLYCSREKMAPLHFLGC